MTEIIVTCVLQILAATVVFGLLSRRYFARIISERRAKKQTELEAQESAREAAMEARMAADKEILVSALSGRLQAVNEANRGNSNRAALVALAEIARRVNQGENVPRQMVLYTLSKLKGTEDIIAAIERAGA